jgi:hypothetical protein
MRAPALLLSLARAPSREAARGAVRISQRQKPRQEKAHASGDLARLVVARARPAASAATGRA